MWKIIGPQIVSAVLSALGKKKAAPAPVKPIQPVKNEEGTKELDWNDPHSKISKYFTVEEAILLREWNRLANEKDGLNDHVKAQLIKIFTEVMDPLRELIGKPIFIKSCYRPSAYNIAIGGAKFSAHMCTENYSAVDWWTDADGDGDKDGEDCDKIKELLMPKLESMNIRMEDNGKGAKWIHVDNKPLPAGGNRFFKP